jgi:hypothetical protein
MNNKILGVLILTVGLAAGFFSARYFNVPADELRGGSQEDFIGNINPGVTMYGVSVAVPANNFYRITGNYPQVMGLPEFNTRIEQFVVPSLEEFKKSAKVNFDARQATAPAGAVKSEFPDKPFDFSVQWEAAQTNLDYISLIVRVDYFNGGANFISQLKTFNYNVKERRNVALADFFSSDPDYLQKISSYSRKQLAQTLAAGQIKADDPILLAGTEPKIENFQNFTFNESFITFYWSKYGVAPGSFGEQTVFLPLNQISKLPK